MEILMTRYIKEIEKDVSLIKKFGNGWYPSFDKYKMFIHKQEKNNENFSKTLKKYNLVRKSDTIYETVFSKDINNISNFFVNDKYLFTSGYGSTHYPKSSINLNKNTCYISNGVFDETFDICIGLIDKGSFVIGVCDNQDSVFYKENKQRLEEIRNFFDLSKIPYKIYKHNNHRDKCYLISYRSE